MTQKYLEVKDLLVKIENKTVLNKINLKFEISKVNVILGPNGAGKSTLAQVLMGNPKYEIVSGHITLNGEDITKLSADKRAKLGIFMSFQHPIEIDGVSMMNFLRTSYNSIKNKNLNIKEFNDLLNEKLNLLNIGNDFKSRFLNYGFSGGEKKKSEILQLLLLEPDFVILDEIDSGLDIDSLKLVSKCLQNLKKQKEIGIIIITHYNKILNYIKPDIVHILDSGKIKKTGDSKLAKEIEEKGFNN